MRRRGALLLEVAIAVALFALAGLAILAMLRDASASLRREGERLKAIDLASSALASIEAGVATPDSLDGPVPAWTEEGAGGEFEDRPPEPTGWSLEIDTERALFDGLSIVTVHVLRQASPGAQGEEEEVYRLRRLVRTGRTLADEQAPEDELLREIQAIERRRGGP